MLSVKAPAKINLTLDIVGKRPDGYHNVAMVMQTVSLYDTVKVDFANGEGEEIRVSCPGFPDVPTDERNIAVKAAKAYYAYTKAAPNPLKIEIEKQIPTGAGLAGGSADGAAVVLAMNRLFDTRLTMDEMADICAKIGADVPFSLRGGTMLATDTGTTLQKIAAMPKCFIVICKPEVSVSTAQAYRKCDEREAKGFLYTDEMVKRLYSRDIRGAATCLYNEFEQVMDLFEINDIKREMLKEKALGASMSGSGSAVFGLFNSEKKAQACANILNKKYKDVFMTLPVKEGCRIE